MPIDYEYARDQLQAVFTSAESALLTNQTVNASSPEFAFAIGAIFSSTTQAFREALLGCLLARLQDTPVALKTIWNENIDQLTSSG